MKAAAILSLLLAGSALAQLKTNTMSVAVLNVAYVEHTNVVIEPTYRGTIQIGTNYYRVGDITNCAKAAAR